jgi:hypothetical protein
MARLGYLYLNEGLWDGQQLVSAAWVEAATSAQTRHRTAYVDYGYQWWVDPSGSYYEAAGSRGQEIYVLPDQDMIVVMTGGSTGGGPDTWCEWLLRSHIIPREQSAAPLPPNPDGVAALESKIQDAAAPVHVQPEPVPPMPEIAQQVDGTLYRFDDKALGLLTFTLSFPAKDEALFTVTTLGEREDPEFEWLIGLDNVDRIAPGRYGLLTSARGWWESDNVFVADIDEIANLGLKLRVGLTFEGDQLSIEVWQEGTHLGTFSARAGE